MSSILGLLFAFTASLFKSGSELSSKYFIDADLNEYVAGFGYRAFGIPVLGIILFFVGIPEVEPVFWIALFVGVPLNVVATILYMKALKLSDISLVSPIKAMAPMALLVTSPIMINEFASPFGVIGVVFVTFGVYALKISSASTDDILAPFRAILNKRGTQYAFVVMIIYSITSNSNGTRTGESGRSGPSPLVHPKYCTASTVNPRYARVLAIASPVVPPGPPAPWK